MQLMSMQQQPNDWALIREQSVRERTSRIRCRPKLVFETRAFPEIESGKTLLRNQTGAESFPGVRHSAPSSGEPV